jgi:type IV secretion system protein TrbJ
MTRSFAAVVLTAGITAIPAFGIFGIGDIVFDPSSYGELVAQLAQLQQQYTQLVKTYETVTSQYEQMLTNAKWIVSKARWRAILTPWAHPTAANTYGTTNGWVNAVNTGAGSLTGYMQAVTKLDTYASVWNSIAGAQQDQIGRNYSGIELSDGATVSALEQLGKLRGNSDAVEFAIDTLENDSLSDSPELNTEVGVLNKINAAGIISVRNSQDTNKLLAAILDHQMVEGKAVRDAQAQSINSDIALRQVAPAVDTQHLSGATAVLTTYRLP